MRVQAQRRHGPEDHKEVVVQQRHVLQRRRARRPLQQGRDRTHATAVYQHREVHQRVLLTCSLRRQKDGEFLSVHLRRRTVRERRRLDERPCRAGPPPTVATDNLHSRLVGRRA